jgi:hypothetical protein
VKRMKASIGFILLAFLSTAIAQSAQELLATTPECAVCLTSLQRFILLKHYTHELQVKCLVGNVVNSTCALTDTPCLCHNAPLQAEIAACILTSCTIKEALSQSSINLLHSASANRLLEAKNATSILCNQPVRNKSAQIVVMYSLFGTLSGTTIILRAISKYMTHIPWSWDDHFILLTFVTGMAGTALGAHFLVENGAGRDVVSITDDFAHINTL